MHDLVTFWYSPESFNVLFGLLFWNSHIEKRDQNHAPRSRHVYKVHLIVRENAGEESKRSFKT